MNNSCYWISLDIHDTASQAVLAVKKGDNSRKICASLTENGKEYAISEGCTAVFTAKKPDGTKLYNDCVIVDNSITYVTTNNTTSAVGLVECEFRLISPEDKLLVCPRFTLIVEDTVVNDDDVMDSSDEFSALSKMVGRVERADSVAQEALETAEEALEKANRADDLVDGCEEATNTLILTHEDIVSGGYVKALKELNAGGKFSFWIGTTEEYNALTEKMHNCFYILTDDASRDEIMNQLAELQSGLEAARNDITDVSADITTLRNDVNATFAVKDKAIAALQSGLEAARNDITATNADITTLRNNVNATFAVKDKAIAALQSRVAFTASKFFVSLFNGEIYASDLERGLINIEGVTDYNIVMFLVGVRNTPTGTVTKHYTLPAYKEYYASSDMTRWRTVIPCSSGGVTFFEVVFFGDGLSDMNYDPTHDLGDTVIIYQVIGVM